MATKSSRAVGVKASAEPTAQKSNWESVTWDDVANWAGPRSMTRGRAYQRGGRVHNLAATSDGRLIAKVSGTRSYTTGVWWEAEVLHSRCTCPVGWNGCKHAVAVLATYLDMLAKGTAVPTIDDTDDKWEELANNSLSEAPSDDFDDGDEDDESEGNESSHIPRRRSAPALRHTDRHGAWAHMGSATMPIVSLLPLLKRIPSAPLRFIATASRQI